ncbi:hypothetical protein OF83DRAFT_1092691 [Amylostereum chailletii]|nr:hypothetical protein OF83DRAFT_1092691 [Amylostereum chailletii]
MENHHQQYQDLSHALHPPLVRSSDDYYDPSENLPPNGTRREEEEEEEEDVVEEELGSPDLQHPSPQPSQQLPNSAPLINTSTDSTFIHHPSSSSALAQDVNTDGSQKRRPGRPKGSRNRKPRESGGSSSSKPQFQNYAPNPSVAPPLSGVTPQNQPYYEFQWRVLNLCSEFYGAAEELVKAAPPLVIAQSYQMGPGNKVDPLNMLNEARRICDQLLQNPSQLVGQAPPSSYPTLPYAAPPQTPASTPASTSSQPPPVITNPQSFVMPLSAPGGVPPPMYPTMYPPRYPTTPYYQYPASSYYPPVQAQQMSTSAPPTTHYASSPPPPPPAASAPATATTINMNTTAGGASGTWGEDEVERLKKLSEESKASTSGGDVDWDWVVTSWGNTRTRHQILLKATSMGLKESTTRGTKRRRDGDAVHNPSDRGVSVAPPAQHMATTAAAAANVAPSPSHTPSNSSAQPSPATHPAIPPVPSSSTTPAPSRPATAASQSASSSMPWPMPTVAANTSPVINSAEASRPNYYRSKQTAAATPSKPASSTSSTTHQYMYQPNGKVTGSKDGR